MDPNTPVPQNTAPVAPVAAPQAPMQPMMPMNSTKNNNMALIIAICVLGALLVIGGIVAAVLLMNKKDDSSSNNSSNNSTTSVVTTTVKTTTPAVSDDLVKAEDDKVTFYYPKSYKKSSISGFNLVYVSAELNSSLGNNNIGYISRALPAGIGTFSDTICSQFASGVASTSGTTVDSKTIKVENKDGISSCRYELEKVSGAVTFKGEQRVLIKKDSTDMYLVQYIHDTDTKSSEIESLKEALEKFEIKD